MKVRASAALAARNPARVAVGGIGVSVLNSPCRLKLRCSVFTGFFFFRGITGCAWSTLFVNHGLLILIPLVLSVAWCGDLRVGVKMVFFFFFAVALDWVTP
jgi:hypothetical protein